jgi:osmoprotectant transport system substrate-binding protein
VTSSNPIAPTTISTATGDSTSSTSTTPLPGTGKPSVVIGDKNFTEQFLLGELYYQALLAQGFDVSLTQNIGSTSVSMQAIGAHTLDLYPEYLNVILTQLAHQNRPFASIRGAYHAARKWAAAHGLSLLPPTPFSDTAGLGVLSSYAVENNLVTVYGLRRVGTTLTVGAPPEFQAGSGGLPALEQAYGFLPAKIQTVNVGDQYAALSAGDVQAAYVNTTDGQLTNPAYTVLADPHHALGYGNVVPVISRSVLAAEGPVFAHTIEKVDSMLTIPVIRRLNAKVDLGLLTPAAVARQFLEQRRVIPVGA